MSVTRISSLCQRLTSTKFGHLYVSKGCGKKFKTTTSSTEANEGAKVGLSKADICMNSKSKFHQPRIVPVNPVRGNVNEEQAGISLQAGKRGEGGGIKGQR